MRCSFCWEEVDDGRIVASGTTNICLRCVAIGKEIIEEAKKKKEAEPPCDIQQS